MIDDDYEYGLMIMNIYRCKSEQQLGIYDTVDGFLAVEHGA